MKTWQRAAVVVVLLSAAGTFCVRVLEPWREDRQFRYAALSGLNTLAELEQAYCFQSGRYTGDILSLASMTPEPQKILSMTDSTFAPGSLRFRVEAASVYLSAAALDRGRTTLAVEARRPSRR